MSAWQGICPFRVTASSAPSNLPAPARFAVFDGDLDAEWAALYAGARALAVDTEAMGLIHGRDRLCLVQICDDNDNVCCIRLHRGQSSAPRLQVLMENPAIEKVFHFARFDVAALAENLAIAVDPIFCTKVASRLGRTYSPAMASRKWCRSWWALSSTSRPRVPIGAGLKISLMSSWPTPPAMCATCFPLATGWKPC